MYTSETSISLNGKRIQKQKEKMSLVLVPTKTKGGLYSLVKMETFSFNLLIPDGNLVSLRSHNWD
jgi:hypothetical protein